MPLTYGTWLHFLVAAVVRISVGSATVSMTMAAGIIASMPMIADLSQIQLATLTIAIASGGTAFSHVNDSGFWLSKSLFEVDEKTNLKTWTVMETLVGSCRNCRSYDCVVGGFIEILNKVIDNGENRNI